MRVPFTFLRSPIRTALRKCECWSKRRSESQLRGGVLMHRALIFGLSFHLRLASSFAQLTIQSEKSPSVPEQSVQLLFETACAVRRRGVSRGRQNCLVSHDGRDRSRE